MTAAVLELHDNNVFIHQSLKLESLDIGVSGRRQVDADHTCMWCGKRTRIFTGGVSISDMCLWHAEPQ